MTIRLYATERDADTRETCIEVLESCFQIAAEDAGHGDILEEGVRVWEAPTEEEELRVMALAWALADEYEQILFWGPKRFDRPS